MIPVLTGVAVPAEDEAAVEAAYVAHLDQWAHLQAELGPEG